MSVVVVVRGSLLFPSTGWLGLMTPGSNTNVGSRVDNVDCDGDDGRGVRSLGRLWLP